MNKNIPKVEIITLEIDDSDTSSISSEIRIKIKNNLKRAVKRKIITIDSDDDEKDSEEDYSPPKPKQQKQNKTKKSTTKNKTTPKKKKIQPNKEVKIKLIDNATVSKKTNKKSVEIESVDSNELKPKIESNTKNVKISRNVKSELSWNDSQRLAELENIGHDTAKKIIKLFENGDTIPFIARYRKTITDYMTAERLRDVKNSYEEICMMKKKADSIINSIKKTGNYTPDIKKSIENCRNIEELNYIYAPYKTGQKHTLAERAKELGLEEPALNILNNRPSCVEILVKGKDGLSKDEIEKGIMHIVAHVMTTNTESLEFIRKICTELSPYRVKIESKKARKDIKSDEELKFKLYFEFSCCIENIKPHQILAINRGESLKVLSVKIIVPDEASKRFYNFCAKKYDIFSGNYQRTAILKKSIQDAYIRKVHPLMLRQIRSELNKKAEKASIEVFALNLKNLLLMNPVKGKKIMGIDPGFKVGCKVSVISELGEVLDTAVIHPNFNNINDRKDPMIVRSLLLKHNCCLIALGNGTACRETETWLTNLIKTGMFIPLDVQYTIVNECGASIYSCSSEAKKDFENLDPLIISAVSLARRVQDPLAELVKVEPKHLGVGMYQHDVNKKLLENTLDEIVSECVSFVGVDLNTASQCLLRRVAGLTDLRATLILKHRMDHGPFTNRYQIKDIKGIGDKIFEQCAGFLRVGPANASEAVGFYKKPEANPLDCTWIHPESYDLTEKILEKFNYTVQDVGQTDFVVNISKCFELNNAKTLGKEFDASESDVQLIIDALTRPFDYDLRTEKNNKPIFKTDIMSLNDLTIGMIVTGDVRNVTPFGAFVDIGVEHNALIHSSKMNNNSVQIGDRVEAKIINLELDRKRIGLGLIQVI